MQRLLIAITILTGFSAPALVAAPIRYSLDAPGRVSAAVYDAEGRLLRTLLSGVEQAAGEHSLAWDGLDRDGRPVEPGSYTLRLLQTPGFTAKFVTALGINPGMKLDDPAYQRTGRHWAGSHDGVRALAMDADGLYLGGGTPEFVPLLLKQSGDGTQRMWERQQFEPAQGAISMAVAHGRLVFLQENGKAMLVDPATGAETGRWDLKHESVKRDPSKYWGSGDKVYGQSTIDLAGHGETLVVSHKGQNLLRWIDAKGQTTAEVNVPAPGGVTMAADGRIWVISEGKVLEVSRDGVKKTVVQGLTAPLRIAFDATRDDLLVVEAAPVEQVKRYALDGTLRATYGRPGGRQDGPYVATDFRGVSSIVTDGQGGFYVCENSGAPRRVAHFDAKGRVAHEWYGPCSFFTRLAVDPRDPTKVWYSPETGAMVLATIDYAAGTWSVSETYHVPGMAKGLFPPELGSYTQGLGVRHHDGRRYLVFGTSPPNIALHEKGRLVPVVAGDQGDAAVARAAAVAGIDPPKAAGYLWTDRNRDSAPQADEIEFFAKPMPRAPKQSATVGPDFTLLNVSAAAATPEGETMRLLRLAPRGWSNGVPDYPTAWEEAAGMTFPKGSHYQHYGVMENGADAYALLVHNIDYQGTGWPTDRNGRVRIAKFDRPGQPGWRVGRHASDLLTSKPGEINEPTGFVGAMRGTVVACDRSMRPAMAWTEDGLYAGSFLDHRAQDGLPDTLYYWASTPDRRDTILNWDQETSGTVFEHEGSVYWIANGWQCLPVYRVSGWDGWKRQEIPVRLAEKSTPAAAEGTGLKGRYFANRDLTGEPAFERTDVRVWFDQRDWYQQPTEVWTDGPKGLGRKTDFSVSWVGEVEAPLTEEFTFSVSGPGRCRLWIDGSQIIHGWNEAQTLRVSKPVTLQAGRRYAIRLDFSTGGQQPVCNLNWESFSIDRQRIPKAYLYPVGDGGEVQVPQPRPATEAIDPNSFFVRNSKGHLLHRHEGEPKGTVLAGYQSIDFGNGVTRFLITCNSWVKAIAGDSKVEVRIDAPDGPLLGTVVSPPADAPIEVTMPVEQKVTGVHDLYLILVQARQGGAYWVDVKDFRFD
ncbi:MAG: PA14 domain-containing protein [Planctomycetia bacterium]